MSTRAHDGISGRFALVVIAACVFVMSVTLILAPQ